MGTHCSSQNCSGQHVIRQEKFDEIKFTLDEKFDLIAGGTGTGGSGTSNSTFKTTFQDLNLSGIRHFSSGDTAADPSAMTEQVLQEQLDQVSVMSGSTFFINEFITGGQLVLTSETSSSHPKRKDADCIEPFIFHHNPDFDLPLLFGYESLGASDDTVRSPSSRGSFVATASHSWCSCPFLSLDADGNPSISTIPFDRCWDQLEAFQNLDPSTFICVRCNHDASELEEDDDLVLVLSSFSASEEATTGSSEGATASSSEGDLNKHTFESWDTVEKIFLLERQGNQSYLEFQAQVSSLWSNSLYLCPRRNARHVPQLLVI